MRIQIFLASNQKIRVTMLMLIQLKIILFKYIFTLFLSFVINIFIFYFNKYTFSFSLEFNIQIELFESPCFEAYINRYKYKKLHSNVMKNYKRCMEKSLCLNVLFFFSRFHFRHKKQKIKRIDKKNAMRDLRNRFYFLTLLKLLI